MREAFAGCTSALAVQSSLAATPDGCACGRASGATPPREASLFLSFIAMKASMKSRKRIAIIPAAPLNGSPVPELTSLYHKTSRGNYGDPHYPGNCSGEFIRDLLRYFEPTFVFDPMTGSGTCGDVCKELGIDYVSRDLRDGFDVADPKHVGDGVQFDFIWLHPPYWRQKVYSKNPRDLSTCPTLAAFLNRLHALILNCDNVLVKGGKLAILMGNYCDRDEGFVDLIYETKRLCRAVGLRQNVTDIIRFSHGARSATKVYRSSFIPGLHDVCMIFEKHSH